MSATGERAKRSLSSSFQPYLRVIFFVPATVLLIFLVVYPAIQTLLLSFYHPSGAFAGLDNYGSVLGNRQTIDTSDWSIPYGTLVNNFLWIAIHLPLSLFTGLYLALTLQKVRGASIVKSFIFLGMVTPMIVGGIILRFLFDEKSGIVPRAFGLLGISGLAIQWTAYPETLLFGLIFGSVWLWVGFSLIVYSAGLTTIPRDYFEAAQMDGASAWQTFRKVTWPLLRPTTLTVVTMTILWELKLFDIVFAATNPNGGVGGAADVLALQMFRYAFMAGNFNDAAVVATLLTGLTLLVSTWMFKRIIIGKGKNAGRLQRAMRRLWARAKPLGRVLKA